jgi:histone-lysine N-methyltransferase SETMAR
MIAESLNIPKSAVLRILKEVRPDEFCSRDFFLLHDNAPAHKAASFCQFLTPKIVRTLYHPPHSPDLSPLDYFLFPKLKMKLEGLHFADVATIQVGVTDELNRVQKEEFSEAFKKLYERAKACIYAIGAYFE